VSLRSISLLTMAGSLLPRYRVAGKGRRAKEHGTTGPTMLAMKNPYSLRLTKGAGSRHLPRRWSMAQRPPSLGGRVAQPRWCAGRS
jgi:hypothetical protein